MVRGRSWQGGETARFFGGSFVQEAVCPPENRLVFDSAAFDREDTW